MNVTGLLRRLQVNIQAPVVQKAESAIHRINLYLLDSTIDFPNTYPLDSDEGLNGVNRWA